MTVPQARTRRRLHVTDEQRRRRLAAVRARQSADVAADLRRLGLLAGPARSARPA